MHYGRSCHPNAELGGKVSVYEPSACTDRTHWVTLGSRYTAKVLQERCNQHNAWSTVLPVGEVCEGKGNAVRRTPCGSLPETRTY